MENFQIMEEMIDKLQKEFEKIVPEKIAIGLPKESKEMVESLMEVNHSLFGCYKSLRELFILNQKFVFVIQAEIETIKSENEELKKENKELKNKMACLRASVRKYLF